MTVQFHRESPAHKVACKININGNLVTVEGKKVREHHQQSGDRMARGDWTMSLVFYCVTCLQDNWARGGVYGRSLDYWPLIHSVNFTLP